MQRYPSLAGNSGIIAYELGPGSITLRFKDGSTYLYTEASTGRAHIRALRRLAARGSGLTTYVNQHVRERFAAKLT